MSRNNQTEASFLKEYDASAFKKPNTTVDIAIFTIIDGALHVLTAKRTEHPFRDQWSLIGGFINVDIDETLEATAFRKLKEKTGVTASYLEQLYTTGNSTRDPRGFSITIVYFAFIAFEEIVFSQDKNTLDINWLKINSNGSKKKLAFDHNEILKNCIARIRSKASYTSIPIYFMPKKFTLGELQTVYEIILNKKIDQKSFRRRMLNADILQPLTEMRQEKTRPAQLYQVSKKQKTHFFMRNIEGVKFD